LARLLKNRLPFVLERPAAANAGRLFPAEREPLLAEAGFAFAIPVRLAQDGTVLPAR